MILNNLIQCISIVGIMSKESLYLLAVFLVSSIAAMFRSYCFNVAGEKFVARLRRTVSQLAIDQLPSTVNVFFRYLQQLPDRKWDSLTRTGKKMCLFKCSFFWRKFLCITNTKKTLLTYSL